MPRYVVIPCVTPLADQFLHAGAIVTADGPEDAAAAAKEWIERETAEDLDPDYLDSMYAIEFTEHVSLNEVAAYERAPQGYECCGGESFTADGHTGSCPNHRVPGGGES